MKKLLIISILTVAIGLTIPSFSEAACGSNLAFGSGCYRGTSSYTERYTYPYSFGGYNNYNNYKYNGGYNSYGYGSNYAFGGGYRYGGYWGGYWY